MSSPKFRFASLSVVKHAYMNVAMAAHPRFEPVVVADDADQPDWVHERNQEFATSTIFPMSAMSNAPSPIMTCRSRS